MKTDPPAISPTELFDGPRSTQRMAARGLWPSLLLNGAAPFVAYRVLTGAGMESTQALTWSAVFPVIGIALGFARARRLDMIGVISLAFIVVGIATSLISGDPRFILIKESLMTAAFGLVCLLSLVFLPRPLMFYFGRQFSSGGDPARAAAFEAMWQYEQFRTVNRNMTLVWGFGYLGEAALRVALSFILSISVFLIISQLLAIGVTFALISWTMTYARRSARRGAERLQGA